MSVCSFCFNAYVDRQQPTNDPWVEPLNDTNDFSSHTIGRSDTTIQLYFNSGNGEACNIEVCKWVQSANEVDLCRGSWQTIGKYYPKYCPECGRKLDEYKIDERGTKFIKRDVV